jgi:hypothetical protein
VSALAALAAVLRDDGGLVAAVVVDPPGPGSDGGSAPAAIVVDGPRTRSRADAYALVVEAVYEGYLLHYGAARIVRTDDADLALLAGDQLYALGLARLVALADLDGVRELADVISLSALARAIGDAELADDVWRAGVRAIAWGADPEHERAKDLLRRGAPGAAAALRAAAGA